MFTDPTPQMESTEPTITIAPPVLDDQQLEALANRATSNEDTSDRIRPLTQIAIIPTELLTNPEFLDWDSKLPRHAKAVNGESRVAVYLTMTKPLRYMLWKLRHLAPDSTPGGLIRKVIEAEYLRNFADEQPQ
jgi:hypothetical protein